MLSTQSSHTRTWRSSSSQRAASTKGSEAAPLRAIALGPCRARTAGSAERKAVRPGVLCAASQPPDTSSPP